MNELKNTKEQQTEATTHNCNKAHQGHEINKSQGEINEWYGKRK